MEKKNNGRFFKTLTFDREVEKSKEKIAYFTDKFNKKSKVVTTWGGIVPNLRYSCQLEITDQKDDANDIIIYKLIKYRIWIDKITLVSEFERGTGETVKVLLDGKEVENLTFDCVNSTDIEEKVKELKTYFYEKTFQLKDKESIAKFVTDYRKACETLYNDYKKGLINSSKK